ncbi:MAG: hypothetical protein IKO90_02280 [Bacteroidales bacterium]|nr:hypothetical protein [Bacteroidales bacterium]MBR4689269.1 hypothetical protein [Bacteroidales bacterium]
MNLRVTQENLYLLLPSKVAWIADMMQDDTKTSTVEVLKKIYSSDTYRQLEKESTKLWHLGPIALYQMMTETKE